MVAERLDIRDMTVPTRNKAMAVMAAVIIERDQAVKTRETVTIAVSRTILRSSVGRSILNQDRTKVELVLKFWFHRLKVLVLKKTNHHPRIFNP